MTTHLLEKSVGLRKLDFAALTQAGCQQCPGGGALKIRKKDATIAAVVTHSGGVWKLAEGELP